MSQGLAGTAPRAPLVAFEGIQETRAGRPLIEAQTARPFLDDLAIAQFRHAVQQILAGLPQVAPIRVRVQFRKAFGERPAAAQSDAQVVHGFRRKVLNGKRLLSSNAAQRPFKRARQQLAC